VCPEIKLKGMYKGKEEDETNTGGFWDLANEIIAQEIAWLEEMAYAGDAPITSQDMGEPPHG